PQNDVTLKMPAFEWVHVQLHQQKGMISLSPPTICNSAVGTTPTAHRSSLMAESGYGLAGLGMGKVKSINQYRLTPGFGGFTPVSYETTECRLPCR
ncbi:hypothetical protein, partial [Escherichia coli]